MEIAPDTKDWTWVLERRCPECGLDTREIRRAEIADTIRDLTGEWDAILSTGERARARPSPQVWSTLEYACHVRDMIRVFDGRLARMLTEDSPTFQNWDQDEAAIAGRYGEQDLAAVGEELRDALASIASHFDGVADDAWTRTGVRSDGMLFTVETLGRYLIHDAAHHVHDAKNQPTR